MQVLSLFDGVGCANIALQNLGQTPDNYVSYEIERRLQQALIADNINVELCGDVLQRQARHRQQGRFDLLVAGSPCQGFSRVGKNLGFDDPRSALYFEFEKVLEETQPTYFMLENVRMSKENERVITDRLGVEPIRLCASTISAISRPRLYWTNIPQPTTYRRTGRPLHEIVDFNMDLSNTPGWHHWWEKNHEYQIKKQYSRILSPDTPSAICQVARQVGNWNGNLVENPHRTGERRFITPEEAEEFHGMPRGYTSMLPRTARYAATGNGWAVQAVEQILAGIWRA